MGLVFVPLTTMSLAAVAPPRLATASGIFNVVRNLGGSIGVAVTTTWLSRQTQVHQATLVTHVTPWSAAVADRLDRLQAVYLAGRADAATTRQQALRHLHEEVHRQAAMQAFVDDFQRLAVLFAAVLPLIWLMRRPAGPPPRPPVEGP